MSNRLLCRSDQSSSHLHLAEPAARCRLILTYLMVIIYENATIAWLHTFKIYLCSDLILNFDDGIRSKAERGLQMLTDVPKNAFTSVPACCRFHKLLMRPSSFSPAFILGDYQWELPCNSNKQLPLLFPSARCKGSSSEGLCHVDVRTDWSRHPQLYRLYLSHLEHHQYRFLMVALMSNNWRLYTAFLNLPQLRLVFCPHKRINREIKFWKTGTNWVFFFLLRQSNSCLTVKGGGL